MKFLTTRVSEASLLREIVQTLWQSTHMFPLWIGSMCIVGLLALAPAALQGQAGNADVVGTVSDASGAVIPDAVVTIHNLNTGAERVLNSNAKGDYTATLLPNGHYSFKVTAKGFKAFSVSSFSLESGDRLRMDAKLEPGAVTEEIKVEASAEAALQTDSSTVTNTIDEKATQDLPLNNRNIAGALVLMPGIVQAATSGTQFGVADRRPSSDVNINGQLPAYNNNLIDGFDNNERNNGFSGVRPSIDGIQEMKVDTSVFRAEVGRAGGGAINLVTKSGTNSFHGSAFEYLRNEDLDALGYNFGATPVQGLYRQNIFGGNVGGPVWLPKVYNGKNKTFFFFDFEMGRLLEGTPTKMTLPTTYELENPGDFSDVDVCVSGPGTNTLYKGVNLNNGFNDQYDSYGLGTLYPDPIALKLWSIIPRKLNKTGAAQYTTSTCGTETYTTAATNNYISAAAETQHTKTWSLRVDHHFSDNDQLFVRFADNPVQTYFPGTFPQVTAAAISAGIYPASASALEGIYPGGNNNNFPGPSDTKSRNLQIDYVHIFNPNLILDLKAGYTRISIVTLPLNYGIGAAAKLGLANVYDASIPSTDVLPIWDIGNFQLGSSNDVPNYSTNNNFQYAGSVTYTRNNHTFKFGAGLIRRQLLDYNNQEGGGAFQTPNASITGISNVAQWMTGYSQVMMRSVDLTMPHFFTWEQSYYAQDDWRLNSKLTLNLGLRYDIFSPWKEGHDQASNFDISTLKFQLAKNDTTVNCSGCEISSTLGVSTHHNNISPRFGFAYSVDSKTVVRGGYGMSWYPLEIGTNSAGSSPSNMIGLPNAPYTYVYLKTPGSPGYTPPHWAAGPPAVTVTGINYLSNPSLPDTSNKNAPTGNCLAYYNSSYQLLDPANTPYDCNQYVTSINVRAKNTRPFMVQQMNLTVQRQIGEFTLTAGFVEVISHGLGRGLNLNQPDPPGANQAVPAYLYYNQMPYVQSVGEVYNGNNGTYSALQVIGERQFKHGLRVNGNYTWAHALDDVWSGSSAIVASNPKYDYGNSSQDIRHRINATMNYTLPFGNSSHGLTRLAIKNWQLVGTFTASSGSAFGITESTHPGGTVQSEVPGLTSDRPSVADGYWNKLKSSKGTITPGYWLNTDAFVKQTLGTAGNATKNLLHGPWSRNSDLSLLKDFDFTEKLKMQFRVEAFDFANLHNWGNPDTELTDSTFGQISAASGNRQMQIALKLMF